MGSRVERSMNSTRGPPTFIIFGENYHLMGSLLPPESKSAKFARFYVVDTQNEIQNRMSIIRGGGNNAIHEDIVTDLKNMLDEHNILVKLFHMVRESIGSNSRRDVKLRLLEKRGKDGRRYISPCEAAWKIFCFNIHYRDPSVVRLGMHLEGEHNVIFQDHENLEDVAAKATVKESMFLGWFEANKKYPKTRCLIYAEFPTKFVWKTKQRGWNPQKIHAVIGRIFFVPSGSGELYYLRLLLNFFRGPTCYEEIRKVADVVYPTFRDACYARELHLTDEELKDLILIDVENILKSYNNRSKDFPTMPFFIIDTSTNILKSPGINRLIVTSFDTIDIN
ncbi:hypothetical protein AHAS_Ahas02G0107200 [Arachis hypogaea]